MTPADLTAVFARVRKGAATPTDATRLLDHIDWLNKYAFDAHGDLVFMAMEIGWASDGQLSTAVRHAKEVLRRRTVERDTLAAQVAAVRDLHRKETRWLPYPDADVSFDTREEAEAEDWDSDTSLTPFDLCAECKRVEEGPCEGECTRENGYATSIWPCPTIRALDPGGDQ